MFSLFKSKRNKWTGYLLFSVLAMPVFSVTPASSQITFKEEVFTPLKWGISFQEFSKLYSRSDLVIEALPGYLQDLNLSLYEHPAIVGFDFRGVGKLRRIAGSFLFESGGKRFYQKDILKASQRILAALVKNYGRPVVDIPWDGSTFVHIWIRQEDLIQLAWNGSDSWGLHFRSRNFDPEFREIIRNLQSLGFRVR